MAPYPLPPLAAASVLSPLRSLFILSVSLSFFYPLFGGCELRLCHVSISARLTLWAQRDHRTHAHRHLRPQQHILKLGAFVVFV